MLSEQAITLNAFIGASTRRRIRRLILTVVSLVLLFTVGTGAAYVAFSNRGEKINIRHGSLLPAPGFVPSAGERVPTKDPAARNAQNILLIGSATLSSVAEGRSDIIVLAHVSDDRTKVHLVYFPRDMVVDVPGYGRDRLNAVYAYGGPQLLVRTVQQLVDVSLDHAAVIRYDGFRDMTDALGGVVVVAERTINVPGYGVVRKGRNFLDGAAAVAYIREQPKLRESDTTRGARALAVLEALMVKSLSHDALSSRVALAEFRDAVTRTVTVDKAFTNEDIRSLTSGLKGLGSRDIVTLTATSDWFGVRTRGISTYLVTVPPMTLLSNALRRDDMDSLPIR